MSVLYGGLPVTFIKNSVKLPGTRSCYREDDREKRDSRAFLVVQQLRIHLPMQGTWVRALVWEDSTCCGATKPMGHNY